MINLAFNCNLNARRVAAGCLHNGIRQPVASKPIAAPKSFATNRSLVVALRSQTSNCKHGRLFLTAFALCSGQIERAQAHILRNGSVVLLRRIAKPHIAPFRREELNTCAKASFSVFGRDLLLTAWQPLPRHGLIRPPRRPERCATA